MWEITFWLSGPFKWERKSEQSTDTSDLFEDRIQAHKKAKEIIFSCILTSC